MRYASAASALSRRSRRQQQPPATARQHLEGLAQPLVVERFRPGPEVGDAVDLRHVAHQAVDRPAHRRRRRRSRRHPVGDHGLVLAPWDETDVVRDDGLDTAGDDLRQEVTVEERLRNPGRAVERLVDELEERILARLVGPIVVRIPAIHETGDVGLERRAERLSSDRRHARAALDREPRPEQHEYGQRRAHTQQSKTPTIVLIHRFTFLSRAVASLRHESS